MAFTSRRQIGRSIKVDGGFAAARNETTVQMASLAARFDQALREQARTFFLGLLAANASLAGVVAPALAISVAVAFAATGTGLLRPGADIGDAATGGIRLGGVALALKSAKPEVRVVAVSADATPVMLRSVEAGKPEDLPEVPTLADSLGGGIGPSNRYTLPLVRDLVDEHVMVSEDEIRRAMVHLLMEERLVAEGASAVGVAALLGGHVSLGRATAVIITGRNVDVRTLLDLVGGA